MISVITVVLPEDDLESKVTGHIRDDIEDVYDIDDIYGASDGVDDTVGTLDGVDDTMDDSMAIQDISTETDATETSETQSPKTGDGDGTSHITAPVAETTLTSGDTSLVSSHATSASTAYAATRSSSSSSSSSRHIYSRVTYNIQNTSQDPDSDNEDVSTVVFAADNVPCLTLYDANRNQSGDVARSGITNWATANIQAPETTRRSPDPLSTSPASSPTGPGFFPQQPMTLDAAEFVPDHLNSEYLQIEEEGRQRRKLLLSFKEISFTIPNVSNAFGFKSSKKKKQQQPSILNSEKAPSHHQLDVPPAANGRSVSDSVVGAINRPGEKSQQQRLISLTNPKEQNPTTNANGSERWLKYLSYTRPTWLPPKSQNDKYKHQADADALIALAIHKDRELERKRLAKINKLAKLQKAETRRWEYAYELAKKNKNSQEYVRKHDLLWHGGIPMQSKFRENIWYAQIGNALNLNNQLIDELFFGEFDNLVESCRSEITELIDAELAKCPTQLQSLSRDNVTKVVVSFLDYLRKLGVPSEKPVIEFYYNGLVHLVATFLHFYNGDTHKVFISLCNLYQRQLPSLLVQYSITKDDSMRLFIENSLKEYIVNKLVKLLEHKVNNQLFHHFAYVDIEYINDILLPSMMGFMQHMFPLNLLVQIMDLYIYEGDTLLMFALLTLFKLNGAKFFGSKQEIINELSMECDVGYDFEFIDHLKEIYNNRQG